MPEKMIRIYEVRSKRVKGIAFHHEYTWILTSLYTGDIVLYDYIYKTVLHTFAKAHDGPCRSVSFHKSQPFFVSCGDDTMVKVWNYMTRQCLITFKGHRDYIRSVHFHHEIPWIISTGDDMTIRIWNWLNKTLVHTMICHEHYIMTAYFHPDKNWIVTASLDNSIAIWDYTTLKNKSCQLQQMAYADDTTDIALMERFDKAHDKAVNCAIFHPTKDWILSASDDMKIRLWKFKTLKWVRARTFEGHAGHISAVAFYPCKDFFLSNGEDRVISLWDMTSTKKLIDKVQIEDKFWALVSHPSMPIFASGSDGGLIVFKYENMRLPSAYIDKHIIHYNNKQLCLWDLSSNEITSRTPVSSTKSLINHDIVSIVKNVFIKDIKRMENFIVINKDANASIVIAKYNPTSSKYEGEMKKIENCSSICYLSKTHCVMYRNDAISSFDCGNLNELSAIDTGILVKTQFDSIYQGTLGRFFLKFKNGIVGLFDVSTCKIIAETTQMLQLRYVVWTNSMTHCALVGTTSLIIVDKGMKIVSKIKEVLDIQTVCFDDNDVMFYSTYFHVKYCLIDGNLKGIIQSTYSPFYLMGVMKDKLYYSMPNGILDKKSFDYDEIKFKLDLMNKNSKGITEALKKGKGNQWKALEELQYAGFSDMSIEYGKSDKEKFALAMKSGRLDLARDLAEVLKERVYYEKLASKAMMMGRLDIVELCYIKSQRMDKLQFYYAITGRQDKLMKMKKILRNSNDYSRMFMNSIYTNDFNERIQILKKSNHYSLAMLTAKLYHNEDAINELNETPGREDKKILFNEKDYVNIMRKMKPITPIKPVVGINHREYHCNWVCLTEMKGEKYDKKTIDSLMNSNEDKSEGNIFELIKANTNPIKTTMIPNTEKISTAWKVDDEGEDNEELKKLIASAKENELNKGELFTQSDPDLLYRKASKSIVPGILLSINNIKSCLHSLKSQLGIHEYIKLKEVMKEITMSNYTHITLLPYLKPIQVNLRHPQSKSLNILIPSNAITLTKLNKMLIKSYDLISNFEMPEALLSFRTIMKYSLFFIATSPQEESQLKSIISICREYIYLIKLSLLSDSFKEKNKVKYCSIIAIMSLCKLELKEHRFIIVKKAKNYCRNIKNFITALHFIKRLTEYEKDLTEDYKKDFEKNREELDLYTKIGSNQQEIDYDTNDYDCNGDVSQLYSSISLTRIKINDEVFNCPLCNSKCLKESKGLICGICDLCTLGESVVGFKVLSDIK